MVMFMNVVIAGFIPLFSDEYDAFHIGRRINVIGAQYSPEIREILRRLGADSVMKNPRSFLGSASISEVRHLCIGMT
jgi:hypothetical protein